MTQSLIINSSYERPGQQQLVLEIKGEDTEQNHAKRAALSAWVDAVNTKGGFGTWCCDVVFEPAQLQDVLALHGAA